MSMLAFEEPMQDLPCFIIQLVDKSIKKLTLDLDSGDIEELEMFDLAH